MKKTTKYWLQVAEYDLGTARGLMTLERYIYVVFMCHQALEKMLKGYITCRQDDPPPYTHNLAVLVEYAGLSVEMGADKLEFIDKLNPYNIQARYPNYKLKIYHSTTSEIARNILQQTEDILQWLKARLK